MWIYSGSCVFHLIKWYIYLYLRPINSLVTLVIISQITYRNNLKVSRIIIFVPLFHIFLAFPLSTPGWLYFTSRSLRLYTLMPSLDLSLRLLPRTNLFSYFVLISSVSYLRYISLFFLPLCHDINIALY